MDTNYEVDVKPDIAFAEHDGVRLLGDLYRPQGPNKAPVLIGIHEPKNYSVPRSAASHGRMSCRYEHRNRYRNHLKERLRLSHNRGPRHTDRFLIPSQGADRVLLLGGPLQQPPHCS